MAQQWDGPLDITGDIGRDGNVGIGTTRPTAELHIMGDSGPTTLPVRIGSANPETNPGIVLENDQNLSAQIVVSRSGLGAARNGELIIRHAKKNKPILFELGTGGEKMRIASNGHIGIGTKEPERQLEVRSKQNSAAIRFGDPYGFGELIAGSNGVAIKTGDEIFRFWINQSTGNVGIGTENPGQKLDVNGTTRTKVIEITGGSDVAEPFEIAEDASPGMVVSIHPENPGQLRLSRDAYDRRVAGIVSGAGGLNPGMIMTQNGTETNGNHPVSMTGRVYCQVDATHGPVVPGDLLTTSDTPGHAMKVIDYQKAQGAILGKAMGALKSGCGLVLVLVTLQ